MLSRSRLSSRILAVASLYVVTATAWPQNSIAPAQSTSVTRSTKHNPPLIPKPQEQFLPYWTAEAGWHTEVQLKNNLTSQPLTVTSALRSIDGRETPLLSVTLQPQEVQTINVHDAIMKIAPNLMGAYGSVVLRYSSLFFRNLTAMAMVHEDGYPIEFHLDAQAQATDLKGGSMEGVWWLPNDTATNYLVLTNQSSQILPVTLSLYDANGKEFAQSLQLGAGSVQRISVRDVLAKAGLSGLYGGVRVSATVGAGSIDAASFVFDQAAGFGALLKMFDRDPQTKLEQRDFAKTGQWTTRAPMLALATPDPFFAFPQGTVLQPQILLRNVTGSSLKTTVRFNWKSSSGTGKAAIPEMTLRPFETHRIDVKALDRARILPLWPPTGRL